VLFGGTASGCRAAVAAAAAGGAPPPARPGRGRRVADGIPGCAGLAAGPLAAGLLAPAGVGGRVLAAAGPVTSHLEAAARAPPDPLTPLARQPEAVPPNNTGRSRG